MSAVVLDSITKHYGTSAAVADVSLTIERGEFVTLLGPSGCGKTTTLRAIAGLVRTDSGTIRIGGQDVTDIPTYRRNIGMVFQSHAVFPHMTVVDNIAFGLRMRGIGREQRLARAAEALEMVRLGGYAGRYPHQLSGGQQQRVALARALVINPDVLLLDEPFGALDRKLREAMQVELRQLTRAIGMTAMFVTHDQEEALMLSDRIVVMSAGRIMQSGTPAAIFERPENRFVADFMGVANFLPATVLGIEDGFLVADGPGGRMRGRHAGAFAAGSQITLAVRGEHVDVSAAPPGDGNRIAGVVETAIYQGTSVSLLVRVEPGGTRFTVRTPIRSAADARLSSGDRVWLAWAPDATLVFPAE